MKYETPELTPLTAAIDAIQSSVAKGIIGHFDGNLYNEQFGTYADWED